ncbi:MAG: diguanylate cyclase [Frankiaceae bacterium]|nr:diguanylate cyclase [Frankiaceae bacterium]
MNVLDLRLLGRLGGTGLLAGAVASLLLVVVPRWGTAAGVAGLVVVLLAGTGGVLAIRSRWEHRPELAGIVLAIGTSLFIGVNGLMTSADPIYGPFYVVVFAWAGLALGPGRCLALVPSTFLCYLLPSTMGDLTQLPPALGVLAIATLAGEVLAHLARQIRLDALRKQSRERDLQRLVSGQIELATTIDPQQAAEATVRLAVKLLRAESAALLTITDGHRELAAVWPPLAEDDVVFDRSLSGDEPTGMSASDGPDDAQGQVVLDLRDLGRGLDDTDPKLLAVTLEIDSQPTTATTSPRAVPGLSGRAVVEVPLRGRPDSGVRGVLAVRTTRGLRPDAFRAGLLRSLVAATTAALESLALAERLRLSAEIDPLTGLGNRRRLGALLARMAPGDAIVSLDLDHFKAVNDTLGHAAGDEVLRDFGAFLDSVTRTGELAVRTGGEEFVLVATAEAGVGNGAEPLVALLDRLGRAWARRYPVTSFSAGVSVYTGGNPDVVLRRADEALYEAKNHGRSCAWIVDAGHALETGSLLPLPAVPFDPASRHADGRGQDGRGQGTLDLTLAGRQRRG